MLGKLIKYDFKAMCHSMLPIFLATIALTALFSLMVKLNIEEGPVFTIFTFLFMTALFGSMFATVFFAVSRFTKGLLKNEGYLSFSLPVDTATHIAAKVINALIWGMMEGFLLIICFIIMGLFMGSVEDVREFFSEMFRAFGLIEKDVLCAALKVQLYVVLEMISSTCLIYAAFAIAHMFDKYKKLIIVAFFVVVSTLRSSLLNLVMSGIRFEKPFNNIFWYLIPVFFAALYSVITWYILDRKLNLE